MSWELQPIVATPWTQIVLQGAHSTTITLPCFLRFNKVGLFLIFFFTRYLSVPDVGGAVGSTLRMFCCVPTAASSFFSGFWDNINYMGMFTTIRSSIRKSINLVLFQPLLVCVYLIVSGWRIDPSHDYCVSIVFFSSHGNGLNTGASALSIPPLTKI